MIDEETHLFTSIPLHSIINLKVDDFKHWLKGILMGEVSFMTLE